MNNRDNKVNKHDPLVGRAKALFDESVQGLDGHTRSRLNRGRQAALAKIKSGRDFKTLSPWVPAAGLAAAAVFAVVLWNAQVPTSDMAPLAEATDFEILMDENSLEMLQELEFYSWIDMEAETDVSEESNVG